MGNKQSESVVFQKPNIKIQMRYIIYCWLRNEKIIKQLPLSIMDEIIINKYLYQKNFDSEYLYLQNDGKQKTYDYLFEILLVGDSFIGKTSLFWKYENIHGTLSNDAFSNAKNKFDLKIMTREYESKRIKFVIINGIEYYKNVYIKKNNTKKQRFIDGVMLFYDASCLNSLHNLKNNHFEKLIKYKINDCERFLIGTKIDLLNDKENKNQLILAQNVAKEFVIDNECIFQVSLIGNNQDKIYENIQYIFQVLAKRIYQRATLTQYRIMYPFVN